MPGRWPDDRHVQRHGGGQRPRDIPGAELFRGIADTYYSHMLARVVGPVRARDLMLTGRVLSAEEAVDWGLVARVVPHDELMDSARDVLAKCCRTAPTARGVVKASLDNYLGLNDRIGMRASLRAPRGRRRISGFQGAALAQLGAPRPAAGRAALVAFGEALEVDVSCPAPRGGLRALASYPARGALGVIRRQVLGVRGAAPGGSAATAKYERPRSSRCVQEAA